MPQFLKGRGEQLLGAFVITLVLLGLAALIPAVAGRLTAGGSPLPTPTPSVSPPPAAVLLPDELANALDGVMTVVDDQGFGTGLLIDAQGDFLTASTLVQGSAGLRLVDNTGGMHQVRLIGVDTQLGVAMLRVPVDGRPLVLADASSVALDDPIVLLASPKVETLSPSTSGTLAALTQTQWSLRLDDLPQNIGGPVVGPGAKVLAVLIAPSKAVPVNALTADIAKWRPLQGTVMPLASFPATLVLRGSDTTTTPSAAASITSVNPSRASAAADAIVTITGSGFISGGRLAVHFLPVAGSSGGFDGLAPSVQNGSTLTVKVPAHQAVQDYVIELINGDGSAVSGRVAFTVIP